MTRSQSQPACPLSTAQRHAFTLVELLVVIAIILVLASLTMLGIVNAQRKARDLACMNNERQLVLGFKTSRAESSDFKLRSWRTESLGVGKEWLCPVASKTNEHSAPLKHPREPHAGRVDRAWWCNFADEHRQIFGSYGVNLWLHTENFTRDDGFGNRIENELLFRSENDITQPVRTPLFCDSLAPSVLPKVTQEAPSDPVRGARRNLGMDAIAIPRHGLLREVTAWDTRQKLPGFSTVSFFDGHVERVPLENLWQLYWHKDYVPSRRPDGPR